MTGHGNATETPRLLLIKKDEYTSFMLPVFHTQTRSEQDLYLKKVIEKVFVRSTRLVDESAPISHIPSYGYHPCGDETNQLPDSTKIALKMAVDQLAKYDSFKPSEDGDLLIISDFARVMTLLLGPINLNPKNLRPGTWVGKKQITTQFFGKYGIDRTSIEGMHEWWKIFCELSSTDKDETARDIIKATIHPGPWRPLDAEKQFAEIIRCIENSLQTAKPCETNYPPLADKFLLVERNKLWLEKVKENSTKHDIIFYAFGALHFPDNSFGPGLINLLKAEGFSVKLIRTLDDVPSAILKRKPLKPMSRKARKEFAKSHIF